MTDSIAFIHTTSLVIEPLKKVLAGLTAQKSYFHLLDEALLRCMMRDGNKPELTVPWLENLAARAARGGASGAVVSCSSLSMSVGLIEERAEIPVVSIDAALYRHVLSVCRNPVILMTNPTNREPAAHMQKFLGSSMSVRLCDGAFEALSRGDSGEHDRQVAAEIESLLEKHDGVLLSQISTERVRSHLPDDVKPRVFSSLDFLGRTLEELK